MEKKRFLKNKIKKYFFLKSVIFVTYCLSHATLPDLNSSTVDMLVVLVCSLLWPFFIVQELVDFVKLGLNLIASVDFRNFTYKQEKQIS